jgi:hypothetical protein
VLAFFKLGLCITALSQSAAIEADSNLGESKSQKFDSPFTSLVNKPNVADAYPFLSGDGLRLYFTSNREGGHGRFFISERSSVMVPFGEAMVLSSKLTDGYYAGSLTRDELTLCMVKEGKLYISKRTEVGAEFEEPVLVEGIKSNYHYGPRYLTGWE